MQQTKVLTGLCECIRRVPCKNSRESARQVSKLAFEHACMRMLALVQLIVDCIMIMSEHAPVGVLCTSGLRKK